MKKLSESDTPPLPAKQKPAVAGKWTDESLPMWVRKQLLRAELEEVQREKAARKRAARKGEGPDTR